MNTVAAKFKEQFNQVQIAYLVQKCRCDSSTCTKLGHWRYEREDGKMAPIPSGRCLTCGLRRRKVLDGDNIDCCITFYKSFRDCDGFEEGSEKNYIYFNNQFPPRCSLDWFKTPTFISIDDEVPIVGSSFRPDRSIGSSFRPDRSIGSSFRPDRSIGSSFRPDRSCHPGYVRQ